MDLAQFRSLHTWGRLGSPDCGVLGWIVWVLELPSARPLEVGLPNVAGVRSHMARGSGGGSTLEGGDDAGSRTARGSGADLALDEGDLAAASSRRAAASARPRASARRARPSSAA